MDSAEGYFIRLQSESTGGVPLQSLYDVMILAADSNCLKILCESISLLNTDIYDLIV